MHGMVVFVIWTLLLFHLKDILAVRGRSTLAMAANLLAQKLCVVY